MLTRWDPFAEISRLQDQMMRWGSDQGASARSFSPAVDIYEDNDSIQVKAEVAGMRPEDVHVQVENDVLTIWGERKLEREDKRDGYARVERSYGSFTRSFALPKGVKADDIDAHLSEGVLTVRLPKAPIPQPKQINVRTSGTGERQIDTGQQTGQRQGQTGQQQTGQQQTGQRQQSAKPH